MQSRASRRAMRRACGGTRARRSGESRFASTCGLDGDEKQGIGIHVAYSNINRIHMHAPFCIFIYIQYAVSVFF